MTDEEWDSLLEDIALMREELLSPDLHFDADLHPIDQLVEEVRRLRSLTKGERGPTSSP